MSEHLSEEQLVLRYYGDSAEAGTDTHLESCAACRAEYRRLQMVLNSVEMPVPERAAEYESQVWAALEPKLGGSLSPARWRSWLRPRTWAPAAAVATLLIGAFFAGRHTQPGVTPDAVGGPSVATSQAPVRERVLLVAVGDHLERSQMVLVELSNLNPQARSDIAAEKVLARNLVDANRLYRQTALTAGDTGVATLLEDLERVLLDVAHSPEKISGPQVERLRHRIEQEGLLFKIRVTGSRVKSEARRRTEPSPGEASL